MENRILGTDPDMGEMIIDFEGERMKVRFSVKALKHHASLEPKDDPELIAGYLQGAILTAGFSAQQYTIERITDWMDSLSREDYALLNSMVADSLLFFQTMGVLWQDKTARQEVLQEARKNSAGWKESKN